MNKVTNLEKNKNVKIIIKRYMFSIIITCIFLFIYSSILVRTNIKENTIMPTIIIITSVSVLIGSSISCLKTDKNGILNGLCIGGTYFITLYIISSLVNMSFFLNIKSLIMIFSGIILGSIGGIVGVNIRK